MKIEEYLEKNGFTDLEANMTVKSAATMAEDFMLLVSAEKDKEISRIWEMRENQKQTIEAFHNVFHKLFGFDGMANSDDFEREVLALKAECQRLREAQRWIPISERLPEFDQQVWVLSEGDILKATYKEHTQCMLSSVAAGAGQCGPGFMDENIKLVVLCSHWMPLQQAPEE